MKAKHELKKELLELKKEGVRFVILNGFKENIEYVLSLGNVKNVERGVYETE